VYCKTVGKKNLSNKDGALVDTTALKKSCG
jgi:hypothetical protein